MPPQHPDTLRAPCARCGAGGMSQVTDSRPWHGMIRRRRRCTKCAHTWATVEVPLELVSELPTLVSSLKQSRESLDRVLDRVAASLEKTHTWIHSDAEEMV